MTTMLRKYLDLEKLMLEAEVVDEAAADALRDRMDAVWYELNENDRKALNERSAPGPFRVLESVRLPAATVFLQRPVSASSRVYDHAPVLGWRSLA